MAQHVFISHSSRDKELADQVCVFLEAQGLSCWIAPRNVPPGAKYGAAIVQAIEDAQAMVFLFSEHSNASEQVMNEIERSVSKKKAIFPIKLSPIQPSTELEYFISRRHWLDLTQTPLSEVLPQLAAALQATPTTPVFRGTPTAHHEALFVLEVSRDVERLRLSAYERADDEEKTVRQHEFLAVDFAAVERIVADMVALFQQANDGTLAVPAWEQVKAHGQTLSGLLLSTDIRQRLATTTAGALLLHLDDTLIHIPWELLFDGTTFFCRRFAMGRTVSTQHGLVEHQRPRQQHHLNMLIVADPQGDLPAAAREGKVLAQTLAATGSRFRVEFPGSAVAKATLQNTLGDYDILHYAGHADYTPENPSQSGLFLADGKLTAGEIVEIGKLTPFPMLIFCNACQSGHTPEWTPQHHFAQEIYGLASALLLAGTQHYIGSLWRLPDEPGNAFAVAFYHELAQGSSIGEAVQAARQRLVERYQETNAAWTSYILYGDPTFRYLPTAEPTTLPTEVAGPPEAWRNVPQSRRSWFPVLGGAALVVLLALAFVMLRKHQATPEAYEDSLVQSYRALAGDALSPPDRQTRIDRLVQSLLKASEEHRAPLAVETGWTSQPLILAFLRGSFKPDTAADETLLSGMEQSLRDTGRFTIVERDLLEKLLGELKLNATDLVDRQTALRVGKILGAGFLAAGSISRQGAEGSLTVRLIHTETSEILVSGTTLFETATPPEQAVHSLAAHLLTKLRSDRKKRYLLRGEIVRTSPGILLNLGAEQGITPGLAFEVVEPVDLNGTIEYFPREDLERLTVTNVQVQSSQVKSSQPETSLQPGWKVREVYEP